MRIAMVGNYSQPHCSENHWALTLEDMQHEVTRIQENEIHPGLLSEIVKGHDLFFWVNTWKGFVTHKDLEEIRALGITSVNYHLDAFVGLHREESLDNDPRWKCDFTFTADGDPKSAEVFKRKGINHYYMKPGVYKAECEYGTYRPELAHDVVFVGGGLEYMHPEWSYRRKLVRWIMDNYSGTKTTALSLQGTWPNTVIPRFGKYGHPQRVMRNQDLNDLYASAKIAIGDSVCIPDFKHEWYWSDRLYETVGRGGFIIHPYIKGLEEEFILEGPYKNLVTYEYGNFDQLKKLIDYYLEHDDEREAIRKAGHEFVKANCTYHNRLQQMLDTVFGPPGSLQKSMNDAIAPLRRIVSILAETSEPIMINFGAGTDPTEGYINVDHLDLPGIDVVHNLMEFPYPFEDESATHIKAVDVVEHLANYTADNRPSVIAFVEECHRILKTGGELFIQTPRYDAEFLWIDPTHVRGFHEESFDFFDPDKHYGQTTGFYSEAKFKVSVEVLDNNNLQVRMVKR